MSSEINKRYYALYLIDMPTIKNPADGQLTWVYIILCFPGAVASTFVADEIGYFKMLEHSDWITSAIISGKLNASWDKWKLNNGYKGRINNGL